MEVYDAGDEDMDGKHDMRKRPVCPACRQTIMRAVYARRYGEIAAEQHYQSRKRTPATWYPIGWVCPDLSCQRFVPREPIAERPPMPGTALLA